MDYGICVPTYIDMWREVQAAEQAGFTHAWFPDSQLIWSDTYAAMALAAERTSTIKLGTLVSISEQPDRAGDGFGDGDDQQARAGAGDPLAGDGLHGAQHDGDCRLTRWRSSASTRSRCGIC